MCSSAVGSNPALMGTEEAEIFLQGVEYNYGALSILKTVSRLVRNDWGIPILSSLATPRILGKDSSNVELEGCATTSHQTSQLKYSEHDEPDRIWWTRIGSSEEIFVLEARCSLQAQMGNVRRSRI